MAKVWLAATIGEARISKSFAASAKIPALCGHIERPAAPFALRLSASLMLGVVRIYSRKSSILVADLSKIISLLSQSRSHIPPHVHSPTSLQVRQGHSQSALDITSKKRTRNSELRQISLPQHDNLANYDAITISVPPSKRRRITARPSIAQTFSELSEWRQGLASTSPEDLLSAMGLFLPTVTVPRQGAHVAIEPSSHHSPSQSDAVTPGSPRHHERSVLSVPWSDVRRAAFRAREEDIKLKESRLDNVFIEDPICVQLSSDDQHTSHESDTPGPVRRLFHDNVTPDVGSDAYELPSHLRPSTYARIPDDLDVEASVTQRDDQNSQSDIFAPLDLEPLQIADFPMLTARRPTHVPSTAELQGLSEPGHLSPHALVNIPAMPGPSHTDSQHNVNNSSPDSGARKSVRVTVSPSTVASPVSADDTTPPVAQQENGNIQDKVAPRRNRRSMRVIMDPRTEFDSEEFRATLLDPSDILLQDGQPRTRSRRALRAPRVPRAIENILWQTPSLLRRFAPEVADVWHQVTAGGWNLAASSQSSPQADPQVNRDDDILNNSEIPGSDMPNEASKLGAPQGTSYANTIAEEVQSGGDLPSGKRSGSPELMREVRSDDMNRSVPSFSGGGRSASQSVPSDTRSGKNERDQLFDIVRDLCAQRHIANLDVLRIFTKCLRHPLEN